MKTKIILIILAIASTALSAGGIALARNAALRRAVVISLPLATLENADYQIPPGTYRLGLHRWTKTGTLVPMLEHVPIAGSGPATLREYGVSTSPSEGGLRGSYRTYILIHPGTRPEHSKGCILTSRENVELLTQLIQTHENVYVTVSPAPAAPAQ